MSARVWWAGLLLLAGCLPACAGGQSGTEGTPSTCRDGDPTPVGPDQLTPAGTVTALAQASGGPKRNPLAWRRYYAPNDPLNHETEVTVTVTVDTRSGRAIEQHPTSEGNAADCGVVLEVGAVLYLQTDDGTFNGAFSGTLRGDSVGGYMTFDGSLAVDEHLGSYDLSDISVPAHARIRLFAGLAPTGWGNLNIETSDGRPASEYAAANWPEQATHGTGLTDGGM